MRYTEHIPAGMAYAAALAFVAGMPLHPMLVIGGLVGGVLPDIDQPNSTASHITTKVVEKTVGKEHHGGDSRGSQGAHSMAGRRGRSHVKDAGDVAKETFNVFAMLYDAVVMGPLTKLWMSGADKVLSPLYAKLYSTFDGRSRDWDPDMDITKHRGGATHSLWFLLTSLPLTLALGMIGSFAINLMLLPFGMSAPLPELVTSFVLGAEMGIISHLIMDSFCVSGVKFIFPWRPEIGFQSAMRGAPKRGQRGICLLPTKMQVNTQADEKLREAESRHERDEVRHWKAESRKLRFWGTFNWMCAILFVLLSLTGVGTGAGSLAIGKADIPTSAKQRQAMVEEATQEGVAANIEVVPDDESTDVSESDGVTRVAESEGPTSLTYGDLDRSDLPAGVMKMPDESLWVVGVGPVTKRNVESPTLTATRGQKDRLLRAALAQRLPDLDPTLIGEKAEEAGEAAKQGAQKTGNLIVDFFNSMTGGFGQMPAIGGTGGYHGGFVGLTPYTPGDGNVDVRSVPKVATPTDADPLRATGTQGGTSDTPSQQGTATPQTQSGQASQTQQRQPQNAPQTEQEPETTSKPVNGQQADKAAQSAGTGTAPNGAAVTAQNGNADKTSSGDVAIGEVVSS